LPGVDWTVEGRWQQAESKRNAQILNHPRVDRLFLAMDAVRNPATGAIACRVQTVNPTVEQLRASVEGRISSVPVSPFINLADAEQSTTTGGVSAGADNTKPLESPIGLDNTIRDCVPFNVMGTGNINQAALDYISDDKLSVGYVDQDFAEVLVSGELFDMPAGPLSFAAGLTWRDQQFIDGALTQVGTGVNGKPVTVDELGPPLNAPALGIRGIPPGFTGGSPNLHLFSTIPNVAGQTDVWEWFGELQVPVWESTWGQSMGFEQRLDVNAAYRESDYDRSGTSESWKVGGDLRVHRDWRVRYTRSQDVREPTFSELFDSQGTGGTVNDPRFANASFQITSVSGGNPTLQPEIADTETAGVVWQPTFTSWIDGLQISVDWYDVEIEGQIATLGLQRILDECELRNVVNLCAQITRDPVTGTIGRIFNTFLNVAGGTVSGTDLEVSYRLEPNFFASQTESFSVRWLTGYVEEETTTPLGGSATDDAGTQGTPDLTSVITTTYGIGPYSFQLQGRYIDSTAMNGTWMEGVDVDDNTIASMTWWNARIGYSGELGNGANWNVNLNIQNLFDEDPPIIPGFGTRGGTQAFGDRFDVFGRRYNLSASYSF
jgi:iron complex outermembrane receptor protein